MSLMFGDNISYLGKKPLDNRSIFKTIEEMKDFSENYLPSLAICQNEEDGEIYLYNKDNEADETTGKWRKLDVTEAESYLKRAKENNPDANFDDVKSLIIGMDNKNSGDNVLEEVSIGFNVQGSIPGIGQIPYFGDSETGRNECKQYIIDNFEAIAAWKNLTPAEYGVSGGWYVNTNDMTFVPASRAPGTTIAVLKKIETVAAENVNLIGVGLKSLNPGTTVLGKYNKTQSGALIIGNGTDDDTRSDAFVIDQDGTIHASNYYIKDEVFHADMIEDDESKSTFIKNKPIYTNGLIGETGPTTYSVVHNAEDKKGEGTYVITLPFDKSKYARLETEQIRNAGAETSGKIGIIDLLTCTSGTTLYHFKENTAAPTASIKFVSLEDNILTLEHSHSYNGLPWPDDPFINILSLDARASFVGVNYDNETITLNEEGQLTANITDDFHVETLPENPEEGMTVQLIGEDYDVYKKGHIYKYIENEGTPPKIYKSFIYNGNRIWTLDGQEFYCLSLDNPNYELNSEELNNEFNLFNIRLELEGGIGHDNAISACEDLKASFIETNGEGPITMNIGGSLITFNRDEQKDFIAEEGTESEEPRWIDIYNPEAVIDTFHVTTMPETPTEGDTVQFIGEDTEEYKKGHIYKYTSEEPITYKAYMSEGILYHHNGDKILYLYRPREGDFDESGNFNPSGITFDMLITLDKIQGLNSYTVELNPDGSLKSYCVDMLDFGNSCIENDFESMGWTSLEDSRLPQFDITVGGDETLKWVDIYSTSTPISYTEGDAISIEDNTISVKYDNETIKLNNEGELIADVNNVVFLTQEEYDELPEEKKEDGTVYSIIGEESGDPKAAFRNPDWSRASTTKITSASGTYTIPEDGIIIFNRITSPNGSTIANFTVNGVGFTMGTNDSGYKGRSAMVAKGDIVEWSGLEMIESPEYTFVPYKIVATDVSVIWIPIGTINIFAGSTAPNSNWLICDGSAISRDVYADLFSVIGTTYGEGDGSTTFNIPDYRETVLVGAGTNDTDDIATHDVYTLGEFKDDQLQDHTHQVWTMDYDIKTLAGDYVPSANGANRSSKNWNMLTGRHGTTTHGKQKGVNYIIRAK